MTVPKHFHILLNSAKMRTERKNGKDHLVVPVVALVEGTIFPFNADTPEFVPAEVMAASVEDWSGQPVVIDHPAIGDKRVSAKNPVVLNEYAVGEIQNPKMDGKQLTMEAWIEKERMGTLNEESKELLDVLEAEQVIEVSIGAFVAAEDKEGVDQSGHPFFSEWLSLKPDHLALLPKGLEGACSIEMGCGAGRTASLHVMMSGGPVIMRETPMVPTMISLLRKKLLEGTVDVKKILADKELRKALRNLELTDNDLRRSLDAALGSEPGFLWVDSVLVQSNEVVFNVEERDGEIRMFKRSFTINADESVELGDGDAEEVRPKTEFVPVTASANPDVTTADCGCQKEGADMEIKNQESRIKALVSNDKTPWTEDDSEFLKGLNEERLAQFETQGQESDPPAPADSPADDSPAPANPPANPPADSPTAQVDVKKEIEETLGLDVETAKAIVEEHKERAAARKRDLISALEAQNVYTKEELEAQDVKALEKLAALAGTSVDTPQVDHTLNGALPRDNGSDQIEKPRTLSAVVKERQGNNA